MVLGIPKREMSRNSLPSQFCMGSGDLSPTLHNTLVGAQFPP